MPLNLRLQYSRSPVLSPVLLPPLTGLEYSQVPKYLCDVYQDEEVGEESIRAGVETRGE